MQTSTGYLESKTSAELKDNNAKAWVVSDDKGQPIATFPIQPEYRYSIETVPRNYWQPKDGSYYVRVREWKCIKNGTLVVFRLYTGDNSDEGLQSALGQAQLVDDVMLRPNVLASWEKITPSFVARIRKSSGYICVLSLKANGRELSGAELDLYDNWASALPLGDDSDRRGTREIDLRDLERYLLTKTPKQNKPPGWTVEIGGRVVAEFPGKPIGGLKSQSQPAGGFFSKKTSAGVLKPRHAGGGC